MAVFEVLQFPDPRLKQASALVTQVDERVRELAREMLHVMYDEPGIGLAAPQIGEPLRLVVMDTDWSSEGGERNPAVVVNPEILSREGKITWEEGCLSVPDFTADVERAERVVVKYQDLDGEQITEDVSGLRAVCFQHEIDHLDGILFIDRISRLKRSLYVKRRKKQLRQEEEPASLGS
ncbi:MAG: peptide deformylase [Myxococcota bacterium]|nr:peptide deformylase [Myxococcota bacterium]